MGMLQLDDISLFVNIFREGKQFHLVARNDVRLFDGRKRDFFFAAHVLIDASRAITSLPPRERKSNL